MTTEERIATLLKELVGEPPRPISVDDIAARVTRSAPVMPARHVRVWLASAAAAAVVLVVATVLALRGSSTNNAPATHGSSAPTAPPSTTAPSTTPPSTTPRTRSTSTPLGAAQTGTIHVGGATLVVPTGWVARSVPGQASPTWCLSRQPEAAPTSLARCAIWFRHIMVSRQHPFDVTADTAIAAFSSQCTAGEAPGHFIYGTRSLGGRSADFSQGILRCIGGRQFPATEYTVATAPAYVLYSGRTDRATLDVTDQIARDATLPAQTAPLRYSILGNIESQSHQRDGYHVVLTPWTRAHGDVNGRFVAIPGGVAQTYVIPDSLVPSAVNLLGLVDLTTDGHRVTALAIVGG